MSMTLKIQQHLTFNIILHLTTLKIQLFCFLPQSKYSLGKSDVYGNSIVTIKWQWTFYQRKIVCFSGRTRLVTSSPLLCMLLSMAICYDDRPCAIIILYISKLVRSRYKCRFKAKCQFGGNVFMLEMAVEFCQN